MSYKKILGNILEYNIQYKAILSKVRNERTYYGYAIIYQSTLGILVMIYNDLYSIDSDNI